MKKQEQKILINIKNELLQPNKLAVADYSLSAYIDILSQVIKKSLELEEIHFFIYKDQLKDHELIILNDPKLSFSIVEKTKKDIDAVKIFLTKNHQIIHLTNGSNHSLGFIIVKSLTTLTLSAEFWEALGKYLYDAFTNAIPIVVMNNEKKRFQLLHHVTDQLYGSMDIMEILTKAIQTLRNIYPAFQYILLLSNDAYKDSDLPIRLLDYKNNDSVAIESFLMSEFRKEEIPGNEYSFFYFPIQGKQGTYGVLQIKALDSIVTPLDIDFIQTITLTVGSAMEKAHLYQQSKQLVKDLQLITKVAKNLNMNLRTTELTCYIIEELKQSFSVEEAGIILYQNEQMDVVPGSTPYFQDHVCLQLLRWIKNYFQQKKESLFIGELSQSKLKIKCPYQSIMAAPFVQEKEQFGFIVVLHKDSYFFSFDSYKVFRSIADHSSLAFSNALLREELEMLLVTDYLTKLKTRNYLDDQMKRSMDIDTKGVFLLIDIDNFKDVNDTYGHQIGDEVLIQIANIIMEKIPEVGIAARWGGEELAIYLPENTLVEGVRLANELVHLTARLSKPHVTISCGVSFWDQNHLESPFTLFRKADEALYKAKKHGKNQAVAYVDDFY